MDLRRLLRVSKIAIAGAEKPWPLAQDDPRPENYHDWRKRVKDHWYHVRLLESLWTEVLEAREASLKNLETWLGDDHNLVVLCDKLTNEPEKYGEADGVQLFSDAGRRASKRTS